MDKTEFSMVLVNKRGELAKLGEVLGNAKVNIEALSISDGIDTGVLKLVVDDPAKAREAFNKEGLQFTEHRILSLSLPNTPGALAEICGNLAEQGVSINYVYGSTCACGDGNCRPELMVSVSDAEAVSALEDAAWWPGP